MNENSYKNKTELLRSIKDEILNLESLPLYRERVKNGAFPVIGEGSNDAEMVFIGEAPGKNEAMTGRPFCGASGKVLDKILLSAGITREDVYITNLVKDRPPLNRDPNTQEIDAYSPFLDRQLEIIRPQIITTLGRFSMAYIMNKFDLGNKLKTISKIHGQVFESKVSWGNILIAPLYHPAVAVYNSNMLPELVKDLKEVMSHIKSK